MEKENYRHIVRIVNTDLDGKKGLMQALQGIRGVGVTLANTVCHLTKIPHNERIGKLSDKQIEEINAILKNPLKAGIPSWLLNRQKDYETGEDMHLMTTDIAYVQSNDVRRMKKVKTYRGMRHAAGLPVRGQNTRSNFRKNKGKVTGVKKAKDGKK